MTVTATTAERSTLRHDSLVISLIGAAHFTSHFLQLTLAPLFPLLHDHFGVNYLQLGSLVTAFFIASGLCQAFAGIWVDKHGARPVLLFGITTMAISFGLASLVTQFWMFYPLLILAGIGNGVFHPSDFASLSHHVSKKTPWPRL